MRSRLAPWLIVLSCLGPVTPARAEGPASAPAPTGFSWQQLPSIRGALLRPDGWYYNEGNKKEKGVEGFFVSKEKVESAAGFSTGVSLFCIRNVEATFKKSPSAYAAQYADAEAAKHELLDRKAGPSGAFQATRFRFVTDTPGKESVTKSELVLANDKTGTVYLVVFQAPTASWGEASQTGNLILNGLLLDEGI